MSDYTGSTFTVDAQQYSYLWDNNIRVGSVITTDSTNVTSLYGIEISDSTALTGGQSFVQGSTLDSSIGISQTFWDSTYIGGSLIDGTYVDGTYLTRLYNPIWINYSLWHQNPPLGTWTLQGYQTRTAMNPHVGNYNVNLVAPDVPGHYEIRWRFQKDQSSYALEIDEPFTVTSWGISPRSDYS